jgi:hypothetical protein
MNKKIRKAIKDFYSRFQFWRFKRIYERDPKQAADKTYYKVFKRHIDFGHPKDLIEKTYWLLNNTDTSLWTLCADKYRMREYIAKVGLTEHLPKLYHVWQLNEDIDISVLPNKFVLKANNGCGTVLVVNNKAEVTNKKVNSLTRQWLRKPFGYVSGQSHYLSIKPCIIAEELLESDAAQHQISPNSLIDYKIWCINGHPECILTAYNRKGDSYYLDLYDTDWNRISHHLRHPGHYKFNNNLLPKPACLEQMLSIASTLAAPFKEVRVDLYNINGTPIIGELTFTAGFRNFTEEFYKYLGSKIELP